MPERWTKATVYRDMWANPADDPRNSEGVSPDGELATLRDYVRKYRLTLLMKCEDLSPAQLAQRSTPPSTMSLLGLVRHLAEVERDWRSWVRDEEAEPKLYGPGDAAFDDAEGSRQLVDEAFTDLAREQERTDTLLEEYADLAERVGKQGIAIRELWIHRVEEYARHCGHADLLRERTDGRVGQ
jgi:uncharacterized damage-inducible protein DinB